MKKGYNLQTLKSSNRSAILYLLNQSGPMSRKQIALQLGLTPAAVSIITEKLIEEKMIVENEAVGNKVGRKEILLDLHYGNRSAIGITFERDSITFSVASLGGTLLEKEVIPFENDFERIKEKILLFYNKNIDKYNLIGMGISIIGLEKEYGIWPNIDIRSEIEPHIDIPLVVRNNVKAFATATMLYGESNDQENILIFKWGPGIGSSFIREGIVLSGDDNGVTEIGHMIVRPFGRPCRCGRQGCLETETALDVIFDEINKLGISEDRNSILSSSNPLVCDILLGKMDKVCLALANATTVLNADKILLLGSVFQEQSFTTKFLSRWNELSFDRGRITIGVSSLNQKSSFIGCTAMVARKFFFES